MAVARGKGEGEQYKNALAMDRNGKWSDVSRTHTGVIGAPQRPEYIVEYAPSATVTPEPVSAMLFLIGAGAIGAAKIRRRRPPRGIK